MPEKLQEQVKSLVKRYGSYEALARETGVAWATIQRWVSGRACPSRLAIRRIQEVIAKLGDEDPEMGYVAFNLAANSNQAARLNWGINLVLFTEPRPLIGSVNKERTASLRRGELSSGANASDYRQLQKWSVNLVLLNAWMTEHAVVTRSLRRNNDRPAV